MVVLENRSDFKGSRASSCHAWSLRLIESSKAHHNTNGRFLMKQAQFGLLAVVLSFTLSAQAKFESLPQMPQIPKFQGKQMDSRYFQIGSIEVTELQTEELRSQDVEIMRFDTGVTDSSGDWIGNLGSTLDQVDLVVDKVINIGKKVWAVVEKGRPVVDIKADVAQAIVDYRAQNGPFKSMDNLDKVPGIGEKTLEKWQGLIVFQ